MFLLNYFKLAQLCAINKNSKVKLKFQATTSDRNKKFFFLSCSHCNLKIAQYRFFSKSGHHLKTISIYSNRPPSTTNNFIDTVIDADRFRFLSYCCVVFY